MIPPIVFDIKWKRDQQTIKQYKNKHVFRQVNLPLGQSEREGSAS